MKSFYLLGLVLLTGCSTLQVATETQPGHDFTRWQSFDFAPGNRLQPADPNVNRSEARQLARTVIAGALTAKGYRWETNATPDFLVGYRLVGAEKRAESATDPFTIGSGPAWEDMPAAPYVRRYREGSLVLLLGDSVTRQIRWRATAVTELQRAMTAAEREAKLRHAVGQLLLDVPPR